MLDTICTLPVTSDLFAQSIHPTAPLLALGLATGHVQIHRLPPCPADGTTPSDGHGTIEIAWRTRRHKGSCRALAFSPNGEHLFSAGTDGLVKAAVTETGQVVSKIAVPFHASTTDPPTLIHTLTPQSLLLATDSSALHIYDLRANSTFTACTPQQTHHPHDDYVSSLTPLPPGEASTSGFSKQWVSTGGTTVAVTDLRRGVLVKSEDMGEELLSSCNIEGKVFVGGERGVLRGWEIGEWDEEEERINVARGESLDVLSSVPEEVGGNKWGGDLVAVGLGDGKVRVVKVAKGKGKVVGEMVHDEVEPVVGLGFEVGGRMVSGGGSVVKVWQESVGGAADYDDEEEAVAGALDVNGGTGRDSDEDNDDGASDDESSEEEKPRKRKKKRKRGKGKDLGNEKQVIKLKGLD